MLLNDKVAVINGAGGEIAGAADPAARGVAAANAFHAAFWVIFVLAALGALTAAIAFPRRNAKDRARAGSISRPGRPRNRRKSLTEMRLRSYREPRSASLGI